VDFSKNQNSKNISFLCKKLFPTVYISICLLTAFVNFIREYGLSSRYATEAAPQSYTYFPQETFYIDFYVFMAIFILSLICILFTSAFYLRLLSYVLGTGAAILLAYTTNDLFTIKFFVFSVWIFCLITRVSWNLNFLLAGTCTLLFVICQHHPSAFGKVDIISEFLKPSKTDTITFLICLLLSICVSAIYRYISEHWLSSEERSEHINMIMTQISIINSKLQHYAKSSGKEAVEQERLRITRDLHDSCGYVFVNISAMMDAAMSKPEISREEADEIFLQVRNMATNGLQETRKTLHAIRDLQEPEESNISSIKKIRDIFKQVTGMNIKFDRGNIRESYGPTVNSVIARTLQEALTNAVRHGHAKNVYIAFWEDNDILVMKVQDDGIGSSKIVKGIGLAGMEERLESQGGKLEVSTPKDGGFMLKIKIPLTIKDKNHTGAIK